MALSESAKTSLAFKKMIGRNYSYHGTAWYEEDPGGGFNVHSNDVWMESIVTAAPASSTSVINVYSTAARGTLKLVQDSRRPGNRAWNAIDTAIDTQILTGWIPPKYGQVYTIKVFEDNGGGVKGTQIFTTDNADLFFDYEAGVLSFQDDPTVSGNTAWTTPFWIEGYHYVGRKKGVQSISTTASTSLTTDIVLAEGTNISLAVTSNTITINGTAGAGATHALLCDTHTDSQTAAPTRGDLISGQLVSATALWSVLSLGYDGEYLKSDGSDALWAGIPLSGLSDVDPTGPAEGDALVYSTSGTWKPKTLSSGGYAINIEEEGAAKINTSASHGFLSFDATDFNVTTGTGTCATVSIVDDGHNHTKFDALSISGNISVAGTLYVCGSVTFQSGAIISGAVTIAGTATMSYMTVTANASVGGTLHVSGAATFGSTVNVSGAVSLASTLHVCGATTLVGGTTICGTLTLNDCAIVTAYLKDCAVTSTKLGGSAVTTAKIQESAVTTTQLGNSAVTTAKLADTAVTSAKLIDCAITTAKLADSSVTTAKINNDAVSPAKLDSTSSYTVGGVMISTAGDTAVNAWRFEISGNNLLVQRYDSGAWTTKATFGP